MNGCAFFCIHDVSGPRRLCRSLPVDRLAAAMRDALAISCRDWIHQGTRRTAVTRRPLEKVQCNRYRQDSLMKDTIFQNGIICGSIVSRGCNAMQHKQDMQRGMFPIPNPTSKEANACHVSDCGKDIGLHLIGLWPSKRNVCMIAPPGAPISGCPWTAAPAV